MSWPVNDVAGFVSMTCAWIARGSRRVRDTDRGSPHLQRLQGPQAVKAQFPGVIRELGDRAALVILDDDALIRDGDAGDGLELYL